MTSGRYHHGDLRAALLDHAERVVAESGVDALSLRELARVAGVSHAAPGAHFASRQDLLDAVAARGFARLEQALRLAKAGSPDFLERVHAVSRTYVDFALGHGQLLNLMYSTKGQTTGVDLTLAESRAYAVFSDLLSEGQREGRLLPGPEDEIGLPFFAAIHGAASLMAAGAVPAERLETTIRNVVERALFGVWIGTANQ